MMNDKKSEQLGGVLVVDDEKHVLLAITRILRKENYPLFTTTSGQNGIKILKNENVGVIISDLCMPEMKGTEFLSEAASICPTTIRILMTASDDLDSTIEAINEGHIYWYIKKPWHNDSVILSIRRAFEKKQLRQRREMQLDKIYHENASIKKSKLELEKKLEVRTKDFIRIRKLASIAEQSQKKHFQKNQIIQKLKVNIMEIKRQLLDAQEEAKDLKMARNLTFKAKEFFKDASIKDKTINALQKDIKVLRKKLEVAYEEMDATN